MCLHVLEGEGKTFHDVGFGDRHCLKGAAGSRMNPTAEQLGSQSEGENVKGTTEKQ